MPAFVETSAAALRLPPERSGGADELKLADQFAEFGVSLTDMPPVLVYRGRNGDLMIMDGVTRASRAFLIDPKVTVKAEVIAANAAEDLSGLVTIEECYR